MEFINYSTDLLINLLLTNLIKSAILIGLIENDSHLLKKT